MGGIVIGFDVGLRNENPPAMAAIRFSPDAVLIRSETLFVSKGSWEGRVAEIGAQASYLVAEWVDPLLVAVEIPFYGGDGENAMTTIKLASVVGAIFGAAHPIGVVAVTPAEGKKALTKNGQATKADMVAAAKIKWGVDISDHEAAAAGVAIAGASLKIGRLHKAGVSIKRLSEMFGIDAPRIKAILKNMKGIEDE